MLKEIDAEIIARRKRRADYMREYGRRRGAMPVKGTLFVCRECNKETPRASYRQKWCRDCKRQAVLNRDRAGRAASGGIVQGTQLICKNCSVEFVKTGRLQYYCLPCCELAKQEKLPAYRKRQLKYQSVRQKRLYRTDPAFALSARISAGIRNSLSGGEGKAGRSWESLVGYKIAELMLHIERQFLPGMSWDNRGSWHIDHRVPLVSFKFSSSEEPEFKAAWALTNLRPLWALDNIRKSGHRTHLL